jgi:hypothetical protein
MAKKQKFFPKLFKKIEKLDDKLSLGKTLGRTMPAVLLTATAITGSLMYLVSVAEIPESSWSLPLTGDETTISDNFVLLYPEHLSTIYLPDEISLLSINGFLPEGSTVTFYAQSSENLVLELGKAKLGSEDGEYTFTWSEATENTYLLWAEVTDVSGTTVQTSPITVTVK